MPMATPQAVMATASRIELTCSTSHTRKAASTPIVANGMTIRPPSCGFVWCAIHGVCSAIARPIPSSSGAISAPDLAQLLNSRAAMAATVRVAALADLHCTKTSHGAFQALFARIAESADMLVMAGDLTDYGLPEEAAVLVKELSTLRIPVAAVLGNHDCE